MITSAEKRFMRLAAWYRLVTELHEVANNRTYRECKRMLDFGEDSNRGLLCCDAV